MCQPRPLFIFVLSKHKFYRRNCELQWDSNSDRRSRRQALWPLDDHQGPWTQLFFYFVCLLSLLAYLNVLSLLAMFVILYVCFQTKLLLNSLVSNSKTTHKNNRSKTDFWKTNKNIEFKDIQKIKKWFYEV